jgi:hypothetical protein
MPLKLNFMVGADVLLVNKSALLNEVSKLVHACCLCICMPVTLPMPLTRLQQ